MLSATAFLLIFGAGLAAALFRHPVFGLYAYMAVFYVHPPSRWWAQSLPDLRWALLAAVVTLLALLIHRKKLSSGPTWITTPPAILLACYAAWLWIQNFWALDSTAHYEASVQFTKYLIAFYFIYRLIDSRERLRDFLMVHVAGCAYLGILAFYSTNFSDGRVNGVGGPGIDDANSLAMFLGTGAIAGAALILSQTGWRRYFSVGAMAFIMNGVVLASSRGALLGLAAAGLVLVLLKSPGHRRLFWALAAVGVLAVGSLMDQRFIDRMFTITAAVEHDNEIDASAETRFVLYEAQVKMFMAYPLGAGHKGTAVLSPLYMDEKWMTRDASGLPSSLARSSHNTFLTTLVEQGVPGSVLFLCLVGWVLGSLIRVRNWHQQAVEPAQVTMVAALCAAIFLILVAGLTTDYLMAEIQFWLLAALAASFAALRVPTKVEVATRGAIPVVPLESSRSR